MLNASQGVYPCEGTLCLLVETMSHHKDFEELSSSRLVTPKRMCVWSFLNEAAKGRALQKSYPSKKNTLEGYGEQEEKEVQKHESSQRNRRLSKYKLSLSLPRE